MLQVQHVLLSERRRTLVSLLVLIVSAISGSVVMGGPNAAARALDERLKASKVDGQVPRSLYRSIERIPPLERPTPPS